MGRKSSTREEHMHDEMEKKNGTSTNFMRNMNMLKNDCQNTLRETRTISNNQRLHLKVVSNFNLTTTCSAQCTELVVLLLSDLIWLGW